MTDFEFRNHGSICIMVPRTNEAVDWVDANVSEDRINFAGGFVVEPRYAENLINGIENDGLTVQ